MSLPRSLSMKQSLSVCQHSSLVLTPSPSAVTSGYRPYTDQQLLTAITGKRNHDSGSLSTHQLDAFPAPLVLPDDEIGSDPGYPPQTFRSWTNLGVRNLVTSRRNVIYVAAPPEIDARVGYMREWQCPSLGLPSNKPVNKHAVDIESVAAYLRAFYHGLEVKLLPLKLTFEPWEEDRSQATLTQPGIKHMALSTSRELIRIRARTTPPLRSHSPPDLFPYTHQLDLNDLTDAALSILPLDAYALLLTTTHDLYESDDDDFCCGRAWGASRVAIVSSARYNPALDRLHEVDRDHIWPASHCREFVNEMASQTHTVERIEEMRTGRKKRKVMVGQPPQISPIVSSLPLEKAVKAHVQATSTSSTQADVYSTRLFRVCRTASHELGHCFGLDHCMYRACVMQGTASVGEDMRQPPYLCPVCERKIAWAVLHGGIGRSGRAGEKSGAKDVGEWEDKIAKWKKDRSLAVKGFCEQQGRPFAALAAWSEGMLELMREERTQP